jgi:hypothetical protein
MAIKYINISQFETLKFFPKLGFLVLKTNHLATLPQIRWSRGVGVLFFLISAKMEFRPYIPSCYSPLFLLNQVRRGRGDQGPML